MSPGSEGEDRSRQPHSVRAQSYAMVFGNLGVLAGGFMIVAFLPDVRRELNLSATQAGLLMAIYAITYALTSPLLGWLATRVSYGLVLQLATLVAAAGCFMAAYVETPAWFLASRIVSAMGAAVFTPTAAAYAVAIHPLDQRGKALSTVALGVSLSQVLALPAAAWASHIWGWRATFVIGGGFLIFMTIILRLFTSGRERPVPLKFDVLRAALLDRWLMTNASLTILFSSVANMIYVFQAEIFIQRAALSASVLGFVLLAVGIGTMAGTWATGRAIDKIGPSATLVAQETIAICTVLPMTMLHYDFAVACVLAIIAGAALFNHIPPLQMRLMRLMPSSVGMIFSINASCVYVGAAIGSFLSGCIVDLLGLFWLGPATAVMALCAMLFLRLLDREP
ncbi:MFS transporter [Rhizobium sp. C4]|uniref:MFS transporter n=1 Tax=Rhizobium sp. C4 TaxID=1349800 RepID=UPI001E42FC0C|nr:MFS transporter [Rhizobium sp. C4]MCD2172224.1 MFS transporter [Rhizobium sp. C4]